MSDAPYSLRLPKDLRTFLESEAKKKDKSLGAFIVEACWSYLEEPKDVQVAERLKAPGCKPEEQTLHGGSNPPLHTTLDMQSLRDICDGKGIGSVQWHDEPKQAMCSYTEWDGDTGEHYRCGLREHSIKVKHTRGAIV